MIPLLQVEKLRRREVRAETEARQPEPDATVLGPSFDLMGSGQGEGVYFRTVAMGSGARRNGSAMTRGGEPGELCGFRHAGPWGGFQETQGKWGGDVLKGGGSGVP